MPEPRLARELLKQVPIFYGLKIAEMRQFLEVCKLTTVPAGQTVCEYGEPSRQLFILLEGSLKVLSRQGAELAEVRPLATVGEMGLITRRPRGATVRAVSAARMLEVGYQRFESLLESHPSMQTRLYRNFIKVLADRLNDANDMNARYKRLLEEGAQPVAAPADAEPVAPPGPVLESPADEAEGGTEGAELPDQSAPDTDAVRLFFELAKRLPNEEDMAEGRRVVAALTKEGYSAADIEYAVTWTVRNIPSARKFGMVQLSIQEALEDKWSI